jgi:hypothetical protein
MVHVERKMTARLTCGQHAGNNITQLHGNNERLREYKCV